MFMPRLFPLRSETYDLQYVYNIDVAGKMSPHVSCNDDEFLGLFSAITYFLARHRSYFFYDVTTIRGDKSLGCEKI